LRHRAIGANCILRAVPSEVKIGRADRKSLPPDAAAVHIRAVPTPQDELKKQAAIHAVRFVQPGMTVGLGTGSTAIHAVREIARRFQMGELAGIRTFATSAEIARVAADAGLPLIGPQGPLALDITIDGADEVDAQLNLIKGGGGALLHEKIVAEATRREVIVIDESKLSDCLGTKYPLPVEVFPFGCEAQRVFLENLGGNPHLRADAGGEPFVTEEGNFIYDCKFGPIRDAEELAAELDARAGVAAHGLFLGLTDDLIVAGPNGLRHLQIDRATGKVRDVTV